MSIHIQSAIPRLAPWISADLQDRILQQGTQSSPISGKGDCLWEAHVEFIAEDGLKIIVPGGCIGDLYKVSLGMEGLQQIPYISASQTYINK